MNIFSLSRILDRGYDLRAKENQINLFIGNEKVAIAERKGGLYRMFFKMKEKSRTLEITKIDSLKVESFQERNDLKRESSNVMELVGESSVRKEHQDEVKKELVKKLFVSAKRKGKQICSNRMFKGRRLRSRKK